jgi:glucosylglycerate phosphorylase
MKQQTERSQVLQERMRTKLNFLYGAERVESVLERLNALIDRIDLKSLSTTGSGPILIAYGDHVQKAGEHPFATLLNFISGAYGSPINLSQLISTVHLLPFYPYSSDDGFSVIDYRKVDPALGTWDDVAGFRGQFHLMFDLVLNHISSHSEWFQAFLRDEAPYRDYILTADPALDLSLVTRPRTHPLLTPYETRAGIRHVWTTFSEDQVDLNFANPDVLLEILDTLLFYVQQGAEYIRLDAIAYLWKIPGTNCIHLLQTHTVVQLMRDVLDVVAPYVKLITETNVPHDENISYFGNGYNEAQLIYNFALPPLVLDALYTGNASILSTWASTLQVPSSQTMYFNFTASHDGIGVRPATGLLSTERIETMLQTVQERGGYISYKRNPDGTQSAYEMNITYFDALAVPDENLSASIDRFMVSQAIMLSLAGIPGIYFNSLIGAANWQEGATQTGRSRTINRQKFDFDILASELADRQSRARQVFDRYAKLLSIWQREAALRPEASQRILTLHESVFAVQRTGADQSIFALHNVSNQEVEVILPVSNGYDLISEIVCNRIIKLQPYQVAWVSSNQ